MQHPPPPPFGFPGMAPLPQPVVVHVAARRGGVGQALLFVLTLCLLVAAFVGGLVAGGAAMLAAPLRPPVVFEQLERPGGGDRIAIIDVGGGIDESLARNVGRAVDHVLADATIRGVVLRVDSPGGAVAPSDRIGRDVGRLVQSGRPVVASYGGVAASGGVFVSCGADAILAEPTTTTGSVGVIASLMTFEGLLDLVGVTPVTLVAAESPRKGDANDLFRSWTDADRAVVQRLLDSAQALFVERVTTGRAGKAADPELLRSVLDGRVFTADEAVAVGLVDGIGYLDDAIAEAERRAGLIPGASTVVRVFRPRPLFGNDLFGARSALVGGDRGVGGLGTAADGARLRDLLDEIGELRLEYRLRFP